MAKPEHPVSTTTGRIRAFQSIPATPTPSFPAAAAMPVTCVPWLLHWSPVSALPAGTFHPGSMRAAKSTCGVTPLSRTAITVDAEPVVMCHAARACTSAPAIPLNPLIDCPVFSSPHWMG